MVAKEQVKYSAADGVLRVTNPTQQDVKVTAGGVKSVVSPGCMKEFKLAKGDKYAVGSAAQRRIQDAPLTPLPNPPRPDDDIVASTHVEGKAPPVITGSTKQPAVFTNLAVPITWDLSQLPLENVIRTAPAGVELDPSMRHVRSGDLVQLAYLLYGVSIKKWDALPDLEREAAIEQTLQLLRASATQNDKAAKSP
jgi:hypothetical protein